MGSNPPPTVVSPAPAGAGYKPSTPSQQPQPQTGRPPSSVGVAPFTPSSVQYGPPPGNANLSASSPTSSGATPPPPPHHHAHSHAPSHHPPHWHPAGVGGANGGYGVEGKASNIRVRDATHERLKKKAAP